MSVLYPVTGMFAVIGAAVKTAADSTSSTTLKLAIVTSITTIIVTLIGVFGDRLRRGHKQNTQDNYASPEYIKALVDAEVAEQRIIDLQEERDNLRDALNAKISSLPHKPRKKV